MATRSRVPPKNALPKVQFKNSIQGSDYEAKRLCLSISSWFCVPDQGMEDLEILCRASAFIVKANNEKYPKFVPKYHIITCSHVVAPWKWPKLYTDDFLKYISEKHTFYSVEMREADGAKSLQAELIPNAYHHPTRDLCVMHLSEEKNLLETLRAMGLNTNLRLSENKKASLLRGQELEFHGHVLPTAYFDAAEDNRLPVPTVTRGEVLYSGPQTLSKTKELLENGMCGGPVIFPYVMGLDLSEGMHQGDQDRDTSAVVCGMVEGIVPADHPNQSLAGSAVFVESEDIRDMLSAIESGSLKPVVGGEIMKFISMDQRPEKMDMEKILGGKIVSA